MTNIDAKIFNNNLTRKIQNHVKIFVLFCVGFFLEGEGARMGKWIWEKWKVSMIEILSWNSQIMNKT